MAIRLWLVPIAFHYVLKCSFLFGHLKKGSQIDYTPVHITCSKGFGQKASTQSFSPSPAAPYTAQ